MYVYVYSGNACAARIVYDCWRTLNRDDRIGIWSEQDHEEKDKEDIKWDLYISLSV